MSDPKIAICSQIYQLQRLKHGSHWADFRQFDALFFPRSRKLALIILVRHDAVLSGNPPLNRFFAGAEDYVEITGIEYVVSACAGGKIVTQEFVHPFKRRPVVSTGTTNWKLFDLEDRDIFTTRHLDDMLRVRVFGNIQGAQFCC